MSDPFSVLCAGFVGADLVLRPVDQLPPSGGNLFVQEAQLTTGGCAANAAVAFARLLGAGGHVALAGRVGADALGGMLRRMLGAAGVDTQHVLETPGAATAINTALVSVSGERSFFVFPGACQHIGPADLPDEVLRRYHHLHLAAIGALPGLTGTAGADVARRARTLGLTISLDTTLNPPRDPQADVLPLLPHVDLFLPNLNEARAVLGKAGLDQPPVDDLLQSGLACGLRLMGIKQGEAGCVLATAHERVHVPALPVPVVDTCGAGDAWSTAVAFAWHQGWPLAEIGLFANAAGALCTLEVGATAGLADQDTIRRFLADRT